MDEREMHRFAREFSKALADQAGAAKGPTPWGSTKALVSDGTATAPPLSTQQLLQVTTDIPTAWIIQMNGSIGQPSVNPLLTFPFARFTVTWGSAGSLESTDVDGFSDQFLMVFGNQVTVSCSWDLDNATRAAATAFGLQFPKMMTLSASAAHSEGARTAAKRTFLLNPGAANTVPIPYAATGVILRSNDPAWYAVAPGGSQIFFVSRVNPPVTFAIDLANPNDIAGSHSRGDYLSVPSLANDCIVVPPAIAPTSPGFLEFLLEP